MAEVFARDSGLLVQWLIDSYYALYEEADLKLAMTEPIFQRKMVGHAKSVLGLTRYKDTVWSTDSSGVTQIREANSFALLRRFNMGGDRPSCNPLIFEDKFWCCFEKEVRAWSVDKLLDTSCANPETDFKRIVFNGYVASASAVNDELWVGGEQLVVITKDLWKKELTEQDMRTIITAIAQVGNHVWTVKGKSIVIWDALTKTIVTEIPDVVGQVKNIVVVGDNVWLPGSLGAEGPIWIINSKTYELLDVLKKHKGTVYHVAQIGDLVWSVSWDRSVFTWNAKFVRDIHNPHTDAVSWIEPIHRPHMNGWQVWTGSYDKSINILFVPQSDNGQDDQKPALREVIRVPRPATAPPAQPPVLPSNPPSHSAPSLPPATPLPAIPTSSHSSPILPPLPSVSATQASSAPATLPPSHPPSVPSSSGRPPLNAAGRSAIPNQSQSTPLGGSASGTLTPPLVTTASVAPVLGARPPSGRLEQPKSASHSRTPSQEERRPMAGVRLPGLADALRPHAEALQSDNLPPAAVALVDLTSLPIIHRPDETRYDKMLIRVKAAFAYEAQSDLELTLSEGDEYQVFETSPDGVWYHGYYIADPSKVGWFPTSFTTKLD